MSRKRSPLPLEVLSFLLATLLGVAIGNLNHGPGPLPWGLELLRRQFVPLAGVTLVLMIGVMVWQRRTEERSARPAWDSDRSPFPGLEAFTEQDSAVFFGRDTEITELLERLRPVVAGQANRLISVVGPSGAGKSSLVAAGVVPGLRRRRSSWIVVPPVLPGDHPLRSLARSLVGSSSDVGIPTVNDLPPRRATGRRGSGTLSLSEFAVLRGHEEWVRCVAWSPDGQRLATASEDRTIRVWDIDSGAECIAVGAHAGGVESGLRMAGGSPLLRRMDLPDLGCDDQHCGFAG